MLRGALLVLTAPTMWWLSGALAKVLLVLNGSAPSRVTETTVGLDPAPRPGRMRNGKI